MTNETASAWDRFSEEYQRRSALPTNSAHYGPDIPTESTFRLLGDLKGKRVLELGCGGAQCSVAFAKAGATAIGVDTSPAQLAFAKKLCYASEVKVELRHADMAELAFLRADSVDVAFSAYAFQYVEDLSRVFRQVHRVLKIGSPLVFSLPHPSWWMIAEDQPDPAIGHSYFERQPGSVVWEGVNFTVYRHSFSDLYGALTRASYRVDVILEPAPVSSSPRSWMWNDAMELVPRTLIVRARKEGN